MRVTRVVSVFAAVALLGIACEEDATGIPAGLEVFTTTLNGANESPPITTTATGHAIVTILGDSLLSWEVIIDSPIDSITLGHIHRIHPDSQVGNVVVNFAPPATGLAFTGTATIGSSAPPDSVIALIREGRGYVNIHTRVNGGGEIRGFLVKQ